MTRDSINKKRVLLTMWQINTKQQVKYHIFIKAKNLRIGGETLQSAATLSCLHILYCLWFSSLLFLTKLGFPRHSSDRADLVRITVLDILKHIVWYTPSYLQHHNMRGSVIKMVMLIMPGVSCVSWSDFLPGLKPYQVSKFTMIYLS